MRRQTKRLKFQKVNDLYDLDDSIPSIYCKSLDTSHSEQ